MDNSFLRLKDTFSEAISVNENAQASILSFGAIQLCPGETYLQISNSETDIVFNDSYDVFLVDECGNELVNVTSYIKILEFTDSNGINQITWEFINENDFPSNIVSLRFRNTVNNDTWWTNFFMTTSYEKEFTTRLDYKNKGDLYGTQYSRSDYYQSIRLRFWYKNRINESERDEYHEISTNRTVSTRNIKKRKSRYILEYFDEFTQDRLEDTITSTELYVNNIRAYSSTPIEFGEPEATANDFEAEMFLNRDDTQKFAFENQLFLPLVVTQYFPEGTYTILSVPPDGKVLFSENIVLNSTGTIKLYNQANVLRSTFNPSDMSVSGNRLDIPGLTAEIFSNGVYYLHISADLISSVSGQTFQGVNDTTTWQISIQLPDYSSADYSDNYLT